MSVPESKFITVSTGVRLHYLEWPTSGPAAVLIHGTSFCADVWTPLAEALSSRWRVIAVDLRGHGQSDKPGGVYSWAVFGEDLAAFTDALKLRGALVVGHSVGAIAAMHVQALRPGYANSVVLNEPMVIRSASPTTRVGDTLLIERTLKRRFEWPSRDDALAYLAQRPPYITWRSDILRHYINGGMELLLDGRAVLRCSPDTEAQVYQARTALDIWNSIAKLDIPALLVIGGASHIRLTPDSDAIKSFQRLAPRSRTHFVADATHFLPQAQPEAFERIVLDFAAQLRNG